MGYVFYIPTKKVRMIARLTETLDTCRDKLHFFAELAFRKDYNFPFLSLTASLIAIVISSLLQNSNMQLCSYWFDIDMLNTTTVNAYTIDLPFLNNAFRVHWLVCQRFCKCISTNVICLTIFLKEFLFIWGRKKYIHGLVINSSARRYAHVKKVSGKHAKRTRPLTHLHMAVFTKS